ncbi:Nn.00g114020.m01.CDS01 [Neocucurbitaria sp. VM-36]
MDHAKVLARVIKSQRSPSWPTLPTRDLPPRHVCEKLVSCYLRTMETVYRVLHVPSFQRDFEALWVTGNEPSMAFIVLLKLVLAIGATVYDEKFSMRTEAIRWIYEAQTWLASPSFKSRLGIQYLQTNILLLLARELIDVGSELVWISAGSVLRAAVYIGLHKDPAHLPRMTILEVEMRRRIWNTILEVSLQASLISGGPTFISLEDFDAEPPGNFNDDQLTTAKPAGQPNSVYTQSSISIALRKTFPARLAVVKFLNNLTSNGTYEETIRIDTELKGAYRTLRRTFQGYTTNGGLAPSPFALQAIDFMMQRYISSLHVPFFGPSLDDPVYAFSRKAMLDSSFKIWNASKSGYERSSESDLARLCRCGAGFFRTFAFHASTFLCAELRAQIQDEDGLDSMSLHSSLLPILDDASNWYLQSIEAGETGVKGYILLQVLAAQIGATKQSVQQSELPGLLVKAAENAVEKCMPLLEAMASQERVDGSDGGSDGFDFQISADFMEDWDLVMSDIFSFGDERSFDAF